MTSVDVEHFRNVSKVRELSTLTKSYSPSWLYEVPPTRQRQMADKIIPTPQERKMFREKARELNRPPEEIKFMDTIEKLGLKKGIKAKPIYPTVLSLDNRKTAFEHEEIEQEYQDLRNILLDPKLKSAEGAKDMLEKSASTSKFRGKSSVTEASGTTKSSSKISKSVSSREPVSVKELMESNNLGTDHFQRHLQCVKKLARRYRRKKDRSVPGIRIQVYE
ncbi:hypothetical protein FSP39_003987 [Pinctada imbricata]|uniref:Uncharacterized protein n=1 Tax=Pinctada imbricata TaxID=66713 RepID=A0AA89BWE6_PINIB|nr:hypothetical protein FSP39_003987 [Pinctada imbricata]